MLRPSPSSEIETAPSHLCTLDSIIEHGQQLKTGTGSELLRDPDVQRSYMGL